MLPVHWEKGSFYTTGYQLVVFLPAETLTSYSKARVFSLIDGKHIADVKLVKGEPIGMEYNYFYLSFDIVHLSYLTPIVFCSLSKFVGVCTCYDSSRNIIWTYFDNKVEGWKNLGLSPKHPLENNNNNNNTSTNKVYPIFSPESILSQPQYALPPNTSNTASVMPLQAIMILISHMDRLARQHPIYQESILPNL